MKTHAFTVMLLLAILTGCGSGIERDQGELKALSDASKRNAGPQEANLNGAALCGDGLSGEGDEEVLGARLR